MFCYSYQFPFTWKFDQNWISRWKFPGDVNVLLPPQLLLDFRRVVHLDRLFSPVWEGGMDLFP
jgi:hypothetical protein